MSDIVPYYMYESGSIPGIPGIFGGGQTVWVDLDTREVVSQLPILAPAIEKPPAHDEVKTEKTSVKDASPVDGKVKG